MPRTKKTKERYKLSQPVPLLLDGIRWRLGDESENAARTSGLKLEPGTVTVLMGPNGVGKTTLLEKLAGLRPAEKLQVSYGSESLWTQSWTGKARLNENALLQYGYACQSAEDGLFARSVGEEMNYSLRPYPLSVEERSEKTSTAMKAVGWDDSWVERDPYRMSGGERRRTALASVFVSPAPWLLLDEPTAGLDGAGHEDVASQLRKIKSSGKGIVLVSHDSDWALALADQVLLLHSDGSLRLCSREQLLEHPQWLEETGMTVPEWLQMAHLLWSNGVSPEQAWHPAHAAAAIAASWPPDSLDLAVAGSADFTVKQMPKSADRGWKHRLAGFDPRSVWLAYVCLSTGLLFLGDWISLAVGAGVVASLLVGGHISLKRWQGLIVNYAMFSIFASLLFAWGTGGNGAIVEWGAFAEMLFPFLRTMLVLLLGLAIPLVMSPLALRRSLEQLVTIKGRSLRGARRLILIVTLMMRFVPVLLELWERFVRIFLARGKTASRNPIAFGRKLRDVAIPFLLALFRLGDEVSLALESRGVGEDSRPTHSVKMSWRLRDYGFVAFAIALAVGLWGFANR
ncbi:ATP-binding cassette domain-containing protein [Cohnella endophytica]|uniref:ATP-binding cassette domain-containing protein n=1 Tax=Cohnella endophytica TaxID=2419778 RepID=A0A494Y293_9BACL|nr:ATP-binding cassette domain-containing protein [Cohnella endophytica]RKP55543.1 ATP-binding cassette domain-containing protein [Cohnella endophytica]